MLCNIELKNNPFFLLHLHTCYLFKSVTEHVRLRPPSWTYKRVTAYLALSYEFKKWVVRHFCTKISMSIGTRLHYSRVVTHQILLKSHRKAASSFRHQVLEEPLSVPELIYEQHMVLVLVEQHMVVVFVGSWATNGGGIGDSWMTHDDGVSQEIINIGWWCWLIVRQHQVVVLVDRWSIHAHGIIW